MFGRVSVEREINVGVTEAWELFGSLNLAKIVVERLTNLVCEIKVVQGDGGTGTILELFFPPGSAWVTWYRERFTLVDHEKRVKEVELTDGGFLDLGFTSYKFRVEVMEKEGVKNHCIAKTTVEYEFKEEGDANIPLVTVQLMFAIMQLAADYLPNNCNDK